MRNTHPGKAAKVIKTETKKVNLKPPEVSSCPVDTPNAITVITASPAYKAVNKTTTIKSESASVPFMNVPLKLAFKTSAFKNNYNIHRYILILYVG